MNTFTLPTFAYLTASRSRALQHHLAVPVCRSCTQKLCKSLGIKILPYMEIVAGTKGKSEGFTCGPSKISLLMRKLEDVSADYCDVETIECTDITSLLPED